MLHLLKITRLVGTCLVLASQAGAEPASSNLSQDQSAGQASTRRLDLSDLMKMEGLGRAMTEPTGRWLLFERIRPYETYPDYGFATYAYGKSGHEIWRLDLTSRAPPEKLPGLDPGAHLYLQTLSPTGRYLSLVEVRDGRSALLLYELETGRIIRPGRVPALSRLGAHEPVWISDHEFVYAALPAGEQPMETSIRMATGRARLAAWQAAWRGDQVSATEIRNDQGPRQIPGALIRVDARSGQMQDIGQGLHAHLSRSPDGRYLAALSRVRQPSGYARDPARLDTVRHVLHIFDLVSGADVWPAPELDIVSAGLTWSDSGARLAFFATGRDGRISDGRHYRLTVRTGALDLMTHDGLDLVSERERGLLQRPERAYLLGEGLAVFARPNDLESDPAARFTYRDIAPRGLPRPDWYLLRPGRAPRNLTARLDAVSPLPLAIGAAGMDVVARDGVYRVGADAAPIQLTPDGRDHVRAHYGSGFLAWPGSLPARREKTHFVETFQGDQRSMLRLDLSHAGHGAGHGAGHEARHEARQVFPGLPATARFLAASPKAGALIYVDSDQSVSRLIVQGVDGPPEIRLVLNAHLGDVDWGDWQPVSHEWEDPAHPGTFHRLQSCLLMPPAMARSSDRLPVILDLYPGARPQCAAREPAMAYPDPQSPYLWAARGYAYARIAAPRELIRREAGPIAGLPDLTVAAREAIGKTGLVDSDRMILQGFSQGAVSALYVASQTDAFAGVIAQNGWADYSSHYLGPPGIYTDLHPDMLGGNMARYEAGAGSDFGMGRSLFEAPDAYMRNSPVLLAGRVTSPVLLIHSDMDVFPKSQFDQIYAALDRFGHPVRYVWYAGEGHGVSSPANIRDMWARLTDFAETVAPDPDMVQAAKAGDLQE